MAVKERSYLMDELGDPNAPVGSRLWCLYVSNEIRKAYYDKTQIGARLRNLIESFTEQQGWQELGFLTWEKFCETRLQVTADKLEAEARFRTAQYAENAKPLNGHEYGNGSPGPGRGHKTDDNYNVFYGTSPDYLAARIARDRPDILERMKQGLYRSVRAAAIDAGIIDPEKSKRHQLPTDPVAAGRYLAQRVDSEWMLECYDAFIKCKG